MYMYYCKDRACQGHTKSWERCCDLRAFASGHKGLVRARPLPPRAEPTPAPTPGKSPSA
jgi:hypothetical protein